MEEGKIERIKNEIMTGDQGWRATVMERSVRWWQFRANRSRRAAAIAAKDGLAGADEVAEWTAMANEEDQMASDIANGVKKPLSLEDAEMILRIAGADEIMARPDMLYDERPAALAEPVARETGGG